MFPSFSFYNRLSNYIVYEVYICCLFSVISQRDPTLLIFQGAKNADSDSSSW